MSINQYIKAFGDVNFSLDKMLDICLSYYYLDFNDNGLLEMDEILQGFILMGNATKKEKIECSFIACDRDNNGILDIEELTSFFYIILFNIYFIIKNNDSNK